MGFLDTPSCKGVPPSGLASEHVATLGLATKGVAGLGVTPSSLAH